jgi:hypothetical protein
MPHTFVKLSCDRYPLAAWALRKGLGGLLADNLERVFIPTDSGYRSKMDGFNGDFALAKEEN